VPEPSSNLNHRIKPSFNPHGFAYDISIAEPAHEIKDLTFGTDLIWVLSKGGININNAPPATITKEINKIEESMAENDFIIIIMKSGENKSHKLIN
jgi:hypothetical protein